jgi:hypothetical protein
MIRKPPASWHTLNEGTAVRTVRTATVVAKSGATIARRGGYAVRALFCYMFAALWGFAALMSGLAMSLPSFIGIGAMAAFMFWLGNRCIAKAREAPG